MASTADTGGREDQPSPIPSSAATEANPINEQYQEQSQEGHENLQDSGDGSKPSLFKRSMTITLPYWLLALLGGLCFFGTVMFLVDMYMDTLRPRFYVPPEVMQDMGLDGVILFRQHDRDNDGVLDLVEFEPLAHRLLEINITHQYELPINKTDEVVTIEAFLTPLRLSSMSKDLDSRPHGLDPLSGLRRWRAVVKKKQTVAAHHFKSWLPQEAGMLDTVGEVYDMVEVPEELEQGVPISSNRYVPPRLTAPGDMLIHVLLAMFHPHPFVMSRFMPHGSVAIVRAVNSRTVDVVFRIHAEFQLNEPPFNPFWFSPAQFTGHLTIDKDGQHVHGFNLYVPNERKLNVDMEWLTGQSDEQNMEVDIGYLPEMQLNITAPSAVQDPKSRDRDEPTGAAVVAAEALQWTEEISIEEAVQKLEVNMYPFKKITYHNMTAAFELAAAEDRLVHHILLWGALDDQSC